MGQMTQELELGQGQELEFSQKPGQSLGLELGLGKREKKKMGLDQGPKTET